MKPPSFLLHFSLPDPQLVQFPPRSNPFPPRPYGAGRSLWHRPFDISLPLSDYTKGIEFPFCVILMYILVISIVNSVNAKREYRPWDLSQTRSFHQFVVLHNSALTIFSAWLFFAFCKTIKTSLPSKESSYYFVTAVDALCKVTGVRGLGKGHTSDHSSLAGVSNAFDLAVVGDRMWNQGLGYFGWIFYVSKVYELVDTVLVVAKGKQSSFLQTYHHAGVILCAWANFRYMAPAYLIPCLLNTFIHTLMITQFLIGIVLNWVYLFLAYDIPVDLGVYEIQDLRFSIKETGDTLKHLVGSQTVHCIDTSGQMFSFVLGMVYVFPLLFLFIRFFIRSYGEKSKVKFQ